MNVFDKLMRGTIVCENCRRRFRQNLEDRPWPGGGVMRMFQCSRCGQEYYVARISARGVAISREIQDLDVTHPKFKQRLHRLQKLLKPEVTRP